MHTVRDGAHTAFEALEPRLLLSADLEQAGLAGVLLQQEDMRRPAIVGAPGADLALVKSQDGLGEGEGVLVAQSSLDGTLANLYDNNGTDVSIPDDNGWVYSSCSTSGAPAGSQITSVEVYLDIKHTWISDLQVDLDTDPITTTWTVHDHEGGSADNINGFFANDTAFDGMDPNQDWDLWVKDDAAGDTGYIDYWSIYVYYSAPSQPDLYDDGDSWSGFSPTTVSPGDSWSAWCDIRNGGSADAGGFWVDYYASTNNIISTSDTLLGSDYISGVSAGSYENSQIDITFPNMSAGTYYVGWLIDADNDVAESNEGNNTDYDDATLTVPSTPPDLRGSGFNVVQEPLDAGDSFDVDYEVENTGGTGAGSFWVDFYLSTNDIISTGDKYLGTEYFSGVSAGGSTGTTTESLTLPAAGDAFWQGSGAYYVGMIVDATNNVAESDETNNDSQGNLVDYDEVQITVQPPWPSWPSTAPGSHFENNIYVNQDGDATLTGKTLTVGDYDFYRLYWDNSATATVETTGSTDTRMAFYDGSGPDETNDDGGSGTNALINRSTSSWTEYWYGVCGYSASTTGSYGLSVDGPAAGSSSISIDPATGDGTRTGNNIGSAWDYDFFSFTPAASGSCAVEVDPTTSWDPVFLLYDSSGAPLAPSTFTHAIDDHGQSGTESHTWNLASGQTYYIRVEDASAAGTGGDFDVRIDGQPVGQPDLYDDGDAWSSFNPDTVTSPGTPGLGQPWDAYFDIRNGGPVASGSFYVDFYASSNTTISTADHFLGRVSMSSIAAGAYANADLHLTSFPSGISLGDYYVGIIIDPTNVVTESDESNNTGVDTTDYPLEVIPPPQPDLVGTHFDAFPDHPLPANGQTVVDFTIANQGTGDAGAFTVDFYLSDNDIISTGDTSLGSHSVGGITAGGTYSHTISLDMPDPDPFVTDNEYWVGMIINPVAGETNTGNNSNEGHLDDMDDVSSEGHVSHPAGTADPDTTLSGAVGDDEWIGDKDVDTFEVDIPHAGTWGFDIDAVELAGGSSLDSVIHIYDDTWTQIGGNDDGIDPDTGNLTLDSYWEGSLAAGMYYVAVRGYGNSGFDPHDLTGRTNGSTGPYELYVEEIVDPVSPTANLADPVNGGSILDTVINGRDYIDVTFADTGGSGLDLATITDAGAEFTLSGPGAPGVTVNGAATLVAGTTYRYTTNGTFVATNPVTVNFLAGSFADNAGNANAAETEGFTVTPSDTQAPTANLADPVNGGSILDTVINGRDYIDVTFADTGGSGLDLATITDAGAEFTLSGPGAPGVTVNGAATLVAGTTYRYTTNGTFVATNPVTVNFLAGSFADNAGNANAAETEGFTVTSDQATVDYTLVLTDMGGNELLRDGGDYVVSPGQQFLAKVYVDDLRNAGASGGVFAAYADLAYDVDQMDWTNVSVDSFFANAQDGTIDEPARLVDEAGGFDGFTGPGADPEQLLFTVESQVHASAVDGTIITLALNAADETGHETLVFGSNDPQSATYESETLRILACSWHNMNEAKDVNDNGGVEPLDALVIINELNNPTMTHTPLPTPDCSTPPPPPYYDVNDDGNLSPLDALIIINYLNGLSTQQMSLGSADAGTNSLASLKNQSVEADLEANLPSSLASNVPAALAVGGMAKAESREGTGDVAAFVPDAILSARPVDAGSAQVLAQVVGGGEEAAPMLLETSAWTYQDTADRSEARATLDVLGEMDSLEVRLTAVA